MVNSDVEEDDYDRDSMLEAQSDVESNFADTHCSADSQRPPSLDKLIDDSVVGVETSAKNSGAVTQRSCRQAPSASRVSSTARTPGSLLWPEQDLFVVHTDAPPPNYETATSSSSSSLANVRSPQTTNSDLEIHDQAAPTSYILQDQLWPFGSRGSQFQHGSSFDPAISFLETARPMSNRSGNGYWTLPQQQSMSDQAPPETSADEETGLLSGTHRFGSRVVHGAYGFLRPLRILILLLILVGVVLIIMLAVRVSNGNLGNGDRGELPGSGPDPPLVVRPSPGNPTEPQQPPIPSVPPTASCSFEQYSTPTIFDFRKLQEFSFIESMGTYGTAEYIYGIVMIRPALEQQDVDIRLSVTTATTKAFSLPKLEYSKSTSGLVLHAPRQNVHDGEHLGGPCLWVYATIEVRSGIDMKNWHVAADNLDIEIADNWFNGPGKDHTQSIEPYVAASFFKTIRGKVAVGHWAARETIVETSSGSIGGSFALRDLLSLRTLSGAIRVGVNPDKVDPDRPRPAEFVAQSSSGAVQVAFPANGLIAEREYRTRVASDSSSISGTYILGASTSIRTDSGSIRAHLLPFADRNRTSQLETGIVSGSTELNILSPHDQFGIPWTARFIHTSSSVSGSINIVYPQEWEGSVYCQSTIGSIRVRGNGLKVIDEEKHIAERFVKAEKGHGQGRTNLKTTSGSIRFQIEA